MFHKKINEYYIFLDEINKTIKINILKLKNIYVIVDINKPNKDFKLFLQLISFVKIHKIPFFIKDNYKLAIKYKANGLFLSSTNQIVAKPMLLNKTFKIIGSAHNQLEYFKKKQQNCSLVIFSPIFYNKKYSINKILNVSKFNLISLTWKINICALGGITKVNKKKIILTRARSLGIQSYIKN